MLHTVGGIGRVLTLIDIDLTHMAVGNGTLVTPATATLLTNEFARKPISDSLFDDNILVKDAFFDENEAIGTIKEIGIFGTGATSVINTGKVFASFRPDPIVDKTNTQSLTVSVEIEVVEVT